MKASIRQLLQGFCLTAASLVLTAEGQQPSSQESHPLAAATLVLANEKDGGSIEIARAYQTVRGIPEQNLIFLPLSQGDTISRQEFVDTIWNPLRETLIERGILLGEITGKDPLGRNLLSLSGSRVGYLMICRGVPFRVAEEADLDDRVLFSDLKENPEPFERFPEPMRINRASVDSELSLLFHNAVPLTALVPNPLFGRLPPPQDVPLLKVTRMDGPTVEAVLNMIRNTLEGERIGLRGRAYVDLALRTGAYALGEEWIEAAAALLEEAHFDVEIERTRQLFQVTDRFDAPAFYLGWYAGNASGVFSLPEFRFPPGAIAVHLHSFSAGQLRNSQRGWVGPFVEAGVSATVGNINEPYLEQTHNLEILTKALLAGHTFADAAYAAVPTLSWQTVAIGDPLYTPFSLDLDSQISLLTEKGSLHPSTDPYVIIRQMNRSLQDGEDPGVVTTQGIRGFHRHASPALALKIAEMEAEAGNAIRARRRLEFAAMVSRIDPMEWVLFLDIAQHLAFWEGAEAATTIIANLLADERLPKAVRLDVLEKGAPIAREAGRYETAANWRRLWHELSAEN